MSESSRYDNLLTTFPVNMATLGMFKPTAHELEGAVKIPITPVKETLRRKSACRSVICGCCRISLVQVLWGGTSSRGNSPDCCWIERLSVEKLQAEKFSVDLNSQTVKWGCFAGTRGQHGTQENMPTVRSCMQTPQRRLGLRCSWMQVPAVEGNSESRVPSGLVSLLSKCRTSMFKLLFPCPLVV